MSLIGKILGTETPSAAQETEDMGKKVDAAVKEEADKLAEDAKKVADKAEAVAADIKVDAKVAEQPSTLKRAEKFIVSEANAFESAVARISFSAYCKLKEIPAHHQAGMKAFVDFSHATFEKWEKAFENY